MERRNTQTKEAVLEALTKTGKAMSRDAIQNKISSDINRATVYRVLNRFHEDGMVHKVVADDGKQYFAVCTNCEDEALKGNHFHFRCTNCETIECMPVPVHYSVPKGYRVENVNCVLSGTCVDCEN